MAGKRTWSMVEIVWILGKWRGNCKIQELVDQYVGEFPNSARNQNQNLKTLRSGIQYVWNKYSKDPSYNHHFSENEIWFIMVKSHEVKGSVNKDFLVLFKEAFPDHDWKSYVDELLAVEAAIAKYQRQSPYCVKWQHDEVCFVFLNRLNPEGWEGLFAAFQVWRNREEVTLRSLQYLYASRHLDKYSSIDELEDVKSNTMPSQNGNLPSIIQSSNKRRFKDDSGREESQNKRVHISSQQQSRPNGRSHRSDLDVDVISKGTHHDTRMGSSSFLALSHPQASICNPCADPPFHLPEPKEQQHSPKENQHRYSNQAGCPPRFYNYTPTIVVSQKNPKSYLDPQVSNTRYPYLNTNQQQPLYSGWKDQHDLTRVYATPPRNGQFSRGRRARTLSRLATTPSNIAPGWSPRDPWIRDNFKPINHRTGSIVEFSGPVSYPNWLEAQYSLFNDPWIMSGMGESYLHCTQVADPSIGFKPDQAGNMQQPLSMPSIQSGLLAAEETNTQFQNMGYPAAQYDSLGVGNLQDSMPQVPVAPLNMRGTGEVRRFPADMDASNLQTDLYSYGNPPGPISTIPDEISGAICNETPRRSYPDRHALPWQSESNSFESLLVQTSAIPGDYSGTLTVEENQIYLSNPNDIPAQVAFNLGGDWPDPPSMVFSDPLCTLGIDEHQNIPFRSMAVPQMQAMHLPSVNMQGKQREQAEPENITNPSGVEDMQAFHDPGASSGGFDSNTVELWKAVDATEPGGFEDFLISGHLDPTILGDFPEALSEAPNNSCWVMGMEDHQALKDEVEASFGQNHLPSSEFTEEPETTNFFNLSSFPCREKLQVSRCDGEVSSQQPAIVEGEDNGTLLIQGQHIEDGEPATPLDVSHLFVSDDGEWIDPDPELLSGINNFIANYGAPEALTETETIVENENLRHWLQEGEGPEDTIHQDV